eukprot:4061450-Amphidinium_carterae.1
MRPIGCTPMQHDTISGLDVLPLVCWGVRLLATDGGCCASACCVVDSDVKTLQTMGLHRTQTMSWQNSLKRSRRHWATDSSAFQRIPRKACSSLGWAKNSTRTHARQPSPVCSSLGLLLMTTVVSCPA